MRYNSSVNQGNWEPCVVPNADKNLFAQVIGELRTAFAKAQTETEKLRIIRAVGALGPHSTRLLPVLMGCLKSPGPLRQSAIEALEAIGPSAAPAIEAMAEIMLETNRGPDAAPRIAARALGRIGRKAAVAPLARAIQSRDEQGPAPFALGALQRLGPLAKDASPVLRTLLRDPNYPWLADVELAIKSIRKSRRSHKRKRK